MEGTSKLLSMRLKDTTKAAMESLLESFEGDNREEQVAALLQEFQTRRTAGQYPGRADDVKAFLTGLESLRKMYESSLEVAVQAHTEAAKEYEMQLASKDQVIMEMQRANAALKSEIDSLSVEIGACNGQLSEEYNNNETLERENYALKVENNKLKAALADNAEMLSILKTLRELSGNNKELTVNRDTDLQPQQ